MTAKSQHSFFSTSGVVARVFIFAAKISPQPVDLVMAAGFGITEILGAKRLWKVLAPALKKQFAEQVKKLLRGGGNAGNQKKADLRNLRDGAQRGRSVPHL